MSWTVEADFGSGLVDITDDCQKIERVRKLHRNLGTSIDTVRFEVVEQSTAEDFLNNDDVTIEIDRDGSEFFRGTARDTYTVKHVANLKAMQIEVVDKLYRLRFQKITSAYTFNGVDLCDTADTGNSVLHVLLEAAGFVIAELTTLTDLTGTANEVYYSVTEEEDKTFWEAICEDILPEFGYVLRQRPDGDIEVVDLFPSSYSATTLADADDELYAPTSYDKSERRYSRVTVRWNPVVSESDAVVWRDTTGQDRDQDMNVALSAGEYYPADCNSETFYAIYEIEDYRILEVTSVSLDVETTGVSTDTFTAGSKRAELCLYSASGGSITKLQIRGDFTAWDLAEKRAEVRDTGGGADRLEVRAKIVSNQTQAQRLASGLAHWHYTSVWEFKGSTDEAIEVGDYITVDSTTIGINVDMRIVETIEREHRPTMFRAETVEPVTFQTDDEYVETSPRRQPPTQDPVNESGSMTFEDDQDGYDAAGGTTTPDTPTLVAVGGVKQTKLAWTRQANLTNFEQYEIQVSDDGGSTAYSVVNGQQVGTTSGVTAVYSEEYLHQDIPLNGTENAPANVALDYRVRAKNKSGATSSWSAWETVTVKRVERGLLEEGAINTQKLEDLAVATEKIANSAILAEKIAVEAVLTAKLSVLARNLHNNPTVSGELNGWGGVREDGSGSAGILSVDATEDALEIQNSGNSGVRHDTFYVEPGQIYRVSMRVKKSAVEGRIFVGLRSETSDTDGAESANGGTQAVARYSYSSGAWSYEDDSTNFYFWYPSDGSSPTSYVDIEVFIVGSQRSVSDCPAPTVPAGTQTPAAKVIDGPWCAIRILNWGNTSSRSVWVKDISVTPIGSGQIIAENIIAGAITTAKLAAAAVTANEIAAQAITAAKMAADNFFFTKSVGSAARDGTPSTGDVRTYLGKDPLGAQGTSDPVRMSIEKYNGENWEYRFRAGMRDGQDVADMFASGFVMGGQAVLSAPGLIWAEESHPFTNDPVSSVAYGNGVIVAVGYGEIARSTDGGQSWGSLISHPFGGSLIYDVAYGNGVFIAGALGKKLARSTDYGASWGSLVTMPFVSGVTAIWGIAYGNGVWVCVGGPLTGDGEMARSTNDGVSWSLITSPFGSGNLIYDVATDGDGTWVAVSEGGQIARSTDDGASFALVTDPFGGYSIRCVEYGDGVFVVGAQNNTLSRSEDGGATWQTPVIDPGFGSTDWVVRVYYAEGVWLAVGDGGSITRSLDGGRTWGASVYGDGTVQQPFGTNGYFSGLTYAPDHRRWVASGETQSPSAPTIISSTWLEAGAGIVERGENNDGNWRKFSDGTMECWGEKAAYDGGSNPQQGSYPVAFVGDKPQVSFTSTYAGSFFYRTGLRMDDQNILTAWRVFWDGGGNPGVDTGWYAIGRWY